MTYFIKGPYTTVTEVRDAITQLQKEGYPDVTHKEDVLDEETTYTPPSEGDRH